MGIDFRGIRTILRWKLHAFHMRTLDAKSALIRRSITFLEDKKAVEEFAAEQDLLDGQRAIEWKKSHENMLFLSIGQALSLWAQMEETLVVIAGWLLDTRFTKAGAVMYSIINFHVWLTLIDELFSLEPRFSPLKPQWNKISERLKRLKDIRDRLAHHSVRSGPNVATLTGDTWLRPSNFDTRKKSLKHEPLNFDQISEFIYSVSSVLESITALTNAMTEIVRRDTLPKTPSEPHPDQNPP